MLGFVNDQLVEIVGFPIPPTVYEVTIKDSHAVLLADGKKVEFGLSWHTFTKGVEIDAKTGKINKKPGIAARFRVVFAGKSINFETV